jgi:hypothetical protein
VLEVLVIIKAYQHNILIFYYNSCISALEIYILTGTASDMGGGVTSSFSSQKIGYIKYTIDSSSSTNYNTPTAILPPTLEDISGITDDIFTLNYLAVNHDLNITGNLFVIGYIYSTVQTCFIAHLNNTYF